MTPEEELATLEARLRSIPRWLEVVCLLDNIRKKRAEIEERFLEYHAGDSSNKA